MSSYSIALETFDTLVPRWEDLLQHSENTSVFTTPGWQRSWWDQLACDHELLLYSFRKAHRLAAIAPLKRKDGQLSFVGSPDVCDYMDFIVGDGADGEIYEALASHLLSLDWEVLSLCGVAGASPTCRRLPGLLKKAGVAVEVRPEDVCPKIDLPSTWDDYLLKLSKKDRHELRRKMRRLHNAGEASYHVVDVSEHFARDLDEFLALLVRSRSDKAQFMTDRMRGFFQVVMPRMAELGLVKLRFLELDGKRVSSAICFDYSDSYQLYNSGYDTEYSPLSVGLLLKTLCLKEAIEAGKKQFNFLRGAETYKYHLGATDETVYTISATRQP